MCYGPYRDNENPDCGIFPTIAEMKEDLIFLKKLSSITRTYGVTGMLNTIPALCQEQGIDCYPGAWISRNKNDNENQIQNLILISKQNLSRVKGLLVGNEAIFRNDVTEAVLIEQIKRVRQATGREVGTAELLCSWQQHPVLAQNVDFLFIHIHPYWDGVLADTAASYVINKYKQMKSIYPAKPIFIGETGWPSQGDKRGNAVPNAENQKRFVTDFLRLAAENNVPYFYFELFDEQWKEKSGEGNMAGHWGLYNSNGTVKTQLVGLLPQGFNRPPRIITPVDTALSLIVYKDAYSAENSFYASGWMGELEDLQKYFSISDSTTPDPSLVLDESCSTNPYSGQNCIRISYRHRPENTISWAGIYWQFPLNNWGDYPGYEIIKEKMTGHEKLEFYARGEKGGEKAEFKIGGIYSSTKPYHDSFGPLTTGMITLTKEWQMHSISLQGRDLSNLIGGFCWVTDYISNPAGCTIYLDNILLKNWNDVDSPLPYSEIRYDLHPNYPNPFNFSTRIKYSLVSTSMVDLAVYSIAGNRVSVIVHEKQDTGTHQCRWDAADYPSGVYLYRLKTDSFIKWGKMMLIK
jgi:exo-beta-1,3-glucanase (GH17 family)